MIKLLRKYNKSLMAVFVVGLMIVFVGGSALSDLMTSRSQNQTIAETRHGEITEGDRSRAAYVLDVIADVGVTTLRGRPIKPIEWVMLEREARRMNVETSSAAARAIFEKRNLDVLVDPAARARHIKPDAVYEALARWMSVDMVAAAMSGVTSPSEAAVRSAAKAALERVTIRAVRLPVSAFMEEDAEFTDEEIRQQFTSHRDREPGGGLAFGYFQQPSVQIQYIKIDRDKIADELTLPEAALEKEALRHYYENRLTDAAYVKVDTEFKPTPKGAAAEPSYLPWEEAQDVAKGAVRKQRADVIVRHIAEWLQEQTSEPWYDLTPREEDGYVTAPSNVIDNNYYRDLLKHVPERYSHPNAMSVTTTDFFSRAEYPAVPGIGAAEYRPPSGGLVKIDVAFMTEGLAEISQEDRGAYAKYLSRYQTYAFALIERKNGNTYMYRVVAARPGAPAETLAVVKEQVVEDLRLLRGFEKAQAKAEALEHAALSSSLREAYDNDAELTELKATVLGAVIDYLEPQPFSRVPQYAAGLGRRSETTYIPPLGFLPNSIVDGCFGLADAAEKVRAFDVEDAAYVLVVEFVELEPARQDAFDDMRETLVATMNNMRSLQALNDWLDPVQIRARNEFKIVR